jgi:N utilization substance protein A
MPEVEAAAQSEPAADGQPAGDVSFDQLFAIKPEAFEAAGEASEDEEEEVTDENGKPTGKKTKKKKINKFRELEYDPERDLVVSKKKHKRGDAGWNEWEE